MGRAVQSPICRKCAHAKPTAALWCSCAVSDQRTADRVCSSNAGIYLKPYWESSKMELSDCL